ncbi:hypothetical protein GSI_11116 [Ganoderma sinense ZZ0214-1]|uniref:Uncharacterized protein n=1 Tax=Ganoderma sinense ZZ0214-1 TaxID=1077348 RepID=A0A2G8RZ41_9APHY|nr:hypothetical protein GSI_11116 [Ganoderma sinense ZZ0214-1]
MSRPTRAMPAQKPFPRVAQQRVLRAPAPSFSMWPRRSVGDWKVLVAIRSWPMAVSREGGETWYPRHTDTAACAFGRWSWYLMYVSNCTNCTVQHVRARGMIRVVLRDPGE